jgi:hypothetical protein
MVLQKNSRINYSLFNSNSINSKISNIKWFKNLYFKINYVPPARYLPYARPNSAAHAACFEAKGTSPFIALGYIAKGCPLTLLRKVTEEKLCLFQVFLLRRGAKATAGKANIFSAAGSSQDSNFISKLSKKKVNQIVTDNSIKIKILVPYSKKNFKVYFLFRVFYFDKIRSNIISEFNIYNSLLRSGSSPSFAAPIPLLRSVRSGARGSAFLEARSAAKQKRLFKLFTNKDIRKANKLFQSYMNNNLNYKEFKIDQSNLKSFAYFKSPCFQRSSPSCSAANAANAANAAKQGLTLRSKVWELRQLLAGSGGRYNEKKNYKTINIFQTICNSPRPIDFFRIQKKSTPSICNFTLTLQPLSPFQTRYKSTDYSSNSESFIYKRLKLIKVLITAQKLEKQSPPSYAKQGKASKKSSAFALLPAPQPCSAAKHAKQGLTLRSKVWGSEARASSAAAFDLGPLRSKDTWNRGCFAGINFVKIIFKNIIDSEIRFLKILFKSSLNLFHLFLINIIESNLSLDSFCYKNKLEKLEKVKLESSTNELIWYYKFKRTKVIYIFNKVLTLLNFYGSKEKISVIKFFENNINETPFLNTFFSNYYYLNILIIKQDKNLPYSLKIIYLNVHSRVWTVFKLVLTSFFYFLFNFNSTTLTTPILKIKPIQLIKPYTLNRQKLLSSKIQNSIKKGKTYKIKTYLNQGLWQLNKKDHNQNSLKWIFNKYWLNLNYSIIISKNLTFYYSFKSNNRKFLKIIFNKMVLTQKIDSNLITKNFLSHSNFLNNFEIRYKVYLIKIGLKNHFFLNLTPQKKVTNLIGIDLDTRLLNKKVLKVSYFFGLPFFNLFKYNVPIILKIKFRPIILFLK